MLKSANGTMLEILQLIFSAAAVGPEVGPVSVKPVAAEGWLVAPSGWQPRPYSAPDET